MIFQNITIRRLEELLKNEEVSVYCFGAGKAFDIFFNEYENYGLLNHVRAIADNHYDEENYASKSICNLVVPIIPVTQMIQNITSKDIILITTAAFQEVESQLEQIDRLKNIKYCIYAMLRIRQKDQDRLQIPVPAKLSMYNDVCIPKTIHYCWFSGGQIPNHYRVWMESWKKYCPDYEIIEWNEKKYDVKKNKYLRQAYELGKWAFVSDYARIDIVNEYGGVYLDTDVELIKNIDEMLKNDAFCGFERNQYVNYGLGFGSIKNHPIVREIKEYYDGISFVSEDGTLNQVNCPIIQTEIMKRHGLICNGESQIVEGMAVYPSRILSGMSPFSFRIQRDCNHTYAIHHYFGSWIEDKSHKNNIISYMKKCSDDSEYYYPDEI